MDLSSVILDFASTYTVTRFSGVGSYVNGKHTMPGSSTFSIQAVVQPINGRELERLPEGLRAGEVQVIFTIERLKVKAPGEMPDVVTIDGANWQVEKVESWETLGNYHRCIVRKV